MGSLLKPATFIVRFASHQPRPADQNAEVKLLGQGGTAGKEKMGFEPRTDQLPFCTCQHRLRCTSPEQGASGPSQEGGSRPAGVGLCVCPHAPRGSQGPLCAHSCLLLFWASEGTANTLSASFFRRAFKTLCHDFTSGRTSCVFPSLPRLRSPSPAQPPPCSHRNSPSCEMKVPEFKIARGTIYTRPERWLFAFGYFVAVVTAGSI